MAGEQKIKGDEGNGAGNWGTGTGTVYSPIRRSREGALKETISRKAELKESSRKQQRGETVNGRTSSREEGRAGDPRRGKVRHFTLRGSCFQTSKVADGGGGRHYHSGRVEGGVCDVESNVYHVVFGVVGSARYSLRFVWLMGPPSVLHLPPCSFSHRLFSRSAVKGARKYLGLHKHAVREEEVEKQKDEEEEHQKDEEMEKIEEYKGIQRTFKQQQI
ncbi:hypothetical protein Pcinc_044082 [Petrolisthes cinctipes]|uniref:Uncharacterized protein n=1 Tax=Petrolisthes cinctipes TaxID=88211 RepID=A0AAE1BEZ2_PETCI|nr:hypothetical protein Pcinc_044082 [Petrolisthes cinctipes]